MAPRSGCSCDGPDRSRRSPLSRNALLIVAGVILAAVTVALVVYAMSLGQTPARLSPLVVDLDPDALYSYQLSPSDPYVLLSARDAAHYHPSSQRAASRMAAG